MNPFTPLWLLILIIASGVLIWIVKMFPGQFDEGFCWPWQKRPVKVEKDFSDKAKKVRDAVLIYSRLALIVLLFINLLFICSGR